MSISSNFIEVEVKRNLIVQLQNWPRIAVIEARRQNSSRGFPSLQFITWIICRCGWKNGIESIAAGPGWRFGIWSRLFDMNIWRWTSKTTRSLSNKSYTALRSSSLTGLAGKDQISFGSRQENARGSLGKSWSWPIVNISEHCKSHEREIRPSVAKWSHYTLI